MKRRGDLSRSERPRLVAVLAALVVLALVATACGSTKRPSSSLATRPVASLPFIRDEGQIFSPTMSYNPYNPDFPFGADYFVILQLAMATPSLTSYVPQVATSWKLHGSTLIVQLRHMKWQNGDPVTSTDVVDSELLNGVASTGVWFDIATVTALNRSTVAFTIPSHVAPTIAEQAILTSFIVSANQFGRFVTPGLNNLVTSYYAMDRINPTKAAASVQGKEISKDFTALEHFSPAHLIGDGPFNWKSWTTNELYLVKSPTFYDAKRVHVPVYEDVQVGPNINGALITGRSDYTTSSLGTSVYLRDRSIPGHDIYFPPSYSEQTIAFNSRDYPLNETAVRQAIAYIIHRPNLIRLVYGTLPIYRYAKHIDGLYYADQLHYLSKSQLSSLNSYQYNPSKASQLLRSAGFHKVGGQWRLPNGHPFTLTLTTPSGGSSSNIVLAYKVFSGWLTAFGIKTTEVAVASAEDGSFMDDGHFEMGDIYIGGTDPLSFMSSMIGSGDNYISSTEPGIGFGPTKTVPGIGKVDVPQTIVREAADVGVGTRMKTLVWDWAKFINKEVPVVAYGEKNYPLTFNTIHYDDWPPKSSSLWALTAINTIGGNAVMIEDGYIRPRG